MTFEPLGNLTLSILGDLTMKRVAALDLAFARNSGEIEKVSWLRATDQKRRVDASLLTENYEQNWNVRAQGNERGRQSYLLQKLRRPVLARKGGQTRRLS